LLLAFNDHVGKGLLFLPDLVRGKLSDVAGLFFFPIFLFALVEVVSRRLATAHRSKVAWSCAFATCVVFTALKTSTVANALAARFWGVSVLDGSDLFALPAAAWAAIWMLRRPRAPRSSPPVWARLGVLGLAAFFSLATSPIREVRAFPEWRITGEQEHRVGCATVRAWVSKTGKEGMGVTLRLSGSLGCAVVVRDARLVLGSQEIVAVKQPPGHSLTGARPVHVYLAFPFDGESAWNQGLRVASLRLDLGSDQATRTPSSVWELPLEYRWDAPHSAYHPPCRGGECQDCSR
jgi:hypothetical protein